MKILELFGGIGACSKALERIGVDYEIADYVEIDKYAVKSFNAIHGTNFEPQDVTKWDKDMQVDLIMHGSPCQDFSVAGKNAGGDKNSGTRSSLMYETLRIVEKLKPKYVIWENVKNLLSKKHRHNFDAYIVAMSELGYVSKYQILNAKDYGVPQHRERVFTVSCRTDGDAIDLQYPESKTRRGRVGHGVSKTLMTSDQMAVVNGYRIRKLTPLECWRLMGFDDADFAKAAQVNSNTQLYKQAGNSIVVNVLEGILKNLLKRDEAQNE